MSFAREKRLLLGLLALLAPVPLPLNGVVGWPSTLLYTVGVLVFLRRAWLDTPGWLPMWMMNVLGVIYIPFFLIDLRALSHGLVAPVLHLGFFALLVKLCALVRERDKWQTAIGIFFIFLAAIGTSTHPTIILYLFAFLALTLLLLTRFAIFHVLAGFGREDPRLAAVPLRRFVAGSTLLAIAFSIPLFLLLPRIRAPFVAGHGRGTGGSQEAVGFSEEVSLDDLGRIRGDRTIALRLQEEGPTPMRSELRLKAATYDQYANGSWLRSPPVDPLTRMTGMRYRVGPGPVLRWASLWLQPLRSRSLPIPVETRIVEPRSPSLQLDSGGSVSFPILPLEVRQYRVGLGDDPVSAGVTPKADDLSFDPGGVTPRIRQLATQVAGAGSAGERAQRLEAYLIQTYSYTLDFVGREGKNPIEDFLFRYRSGHCELFASSLVLMLRSQGIPARLVTGFLGGEFNPFEGYTMIRNENAHAWVEAYVPGEGWRIFDPTPPGGRPTAGEQGTFRLFQQAWDYVEFRWDRYVLTFGLYDQMRLLGGLRSLWQDFWAKFRRESRPKPQPSVVQGIEGPKPAHDEASPWWTRLDLPLLIGLAALALAASGLLVWLRLRRPLTATGAYRRLRRYLDRTGRPLGPAAAPLAVRNEAATRFPQAAEPTAKVIGFYIRESFGGEELGESERMELAAALEQARKSMRKVG